MGVYIVTRFIGEPVIPDVNVEYTIVNAQTAAVTMVLWEITRVLGGLTFYAAGSNQLAKSNPPPWKEMVMFDMTITRYN